MVINNIGNSNDILMGLSLNLRRLKKYWQAIDSVPLNDMLMGTSKY